MRPWIVAVVFGLIVAVSSAAEARTPVRKALKGTAVGVAKAVRTPVKFFKTKQPVRRVIRWIVR